MAVRRKIGNLAQVLLQSHLQKRQMEHQSDLVKQRQMEMAEIQQLDRLERAKDAQRFALLGKGLEDPAMMEQFARSGIDVGPDPNLFRPSDEKIMSTFTAGLSKAKRDELPTDLGVESRLGATPWGGDLAKDPRAVKQGMMARDDRKGQLDTIDAYETDLQGGKAFAQAHGQAMGKESADATNFPAQLERKVEDFETMAPLEFVKLQKEESMKAMLQLERFKKEKVFELAAAGQQQFAKAMNDQIIGLQNAVQGIEEIVALAEEVNAGNIGPVHDVYSGLKDAMGTLPYVGAPIRQFMATGTAVVAALKDGDPTLVRKAQRLEAARREAALRAIRAAGDPRPSDQDVLGVLPTIPGFGMSREATAEAASYWRDMLTIVPEVAAQNPGLVGKPLLDLAAAEAKRRSAARIAVGPQHPSAPLPRDPLNPANAQPPLGQPHNPAQVPEDPASRLRRLRKAAGRQ